MKTILVLLFLCGPVFAQKKTTVALLDLTVSEELPKNIAPVLSNLIRQEFVKSEAFDILDRSNMESILKEQNFTMTDNCNSRECAVQVGQLLGVEKMLFGDIGSLGKKILVNLQLVDVSTGKIEKIENESHIGAIEDIDAVIIKLAKKISGAKVAESSSGAYQVYVTSEPEGASIYVGEELRGTTPATLTFKNEAAVKIYVKAESYQDWFQEVLPKKDEKIIITAKLLKGTSGKSVKSGGMTEDELKVRYELYNMKKKSSAAAFGLSFLVGQFGTGHFYAKSYTRGLIIGAVGCVGYYSMIRSIKDQDPPTIGLILLMGAYVSDIVGAQFAVRSYNENLKKELKISLVPTRNLKGGELRFSVAL